jgi:hypothetical protein
MGRKDTTPRGATKIRIRKMLGLSNMIVVLRRSFTSEHVRICENKSLFLFLNLALAKFSSIFSVIQNAIPFQHYQKFSTYLLTESQN